MAQAGVQVERHLSCPSCKRRKIKCDRKHPCSQCVVRGEEAQCQELVRYNALSLASPLDSLAAAAATSASSSSSSATGKRPPSASISGSDAAGNAAVAAAAAAGANATSAGEDNHQLASSSSSSSSSTPTSPTTSSKLLTRMRLLEARVARLEGGGVDAPLNEDSSKTGEMAVAATKTENGARHDPAAYLMVEDVAMGGRREKRARLAMEDGPSTSTSSSRSSPGAVAALVTAAGAQQRQSVGMQGGATSSGNGGTSSGLGARKKKRARMFASTAKGAAKRKIRKVQNNDQILALLPDAPTTRILIDFYFQDLDWLLKVLDEQTYRTEIDAFLNGGPVVNLDAGLLACHLVILCLGFHLCSREKLLAMGFTPPMAAQQAAALFETSRQVLLDSCRFLSGGGPVRMDDVACVAIMSLYQYDEVGEGQGDAAWVLLGAAIKNAQVLGLADVDAKAKVSAWRQQDRQRARRLWWFLVWLDWSHATGHGFKYSCHPEQMSTKYPFDTMSLNGESDIAPPNLYTPNGFSIQRSRLVELYRESVDQHNHQGGTLSLEATWALDEKLQNIEKTMPSYFRAAPPNGQYVSRQHAFESLMLRLNVQNRFLRLHRPFQLVGVHQENTKTKSKSNKGVSQDSHQAELTPSQRRCYESASAIVDLLQEASESQVASLLRLWIVSLYALGAALSLFVALCQRDSMETRQRLEVLLNLFEANKEGSQTCNNAYRLLRALRAVELSHRRVNKADEIFGKVVARFLREGEAKAEEEEEDSEDESEEEDNEEEEQEESKGAMMNDQTMIANPTTTDEGPHALHLLSPMQHQHPHHHPSPFSFVSPAPQHHHHHQHHQLPPQQQQDYAPIHVPDVFSLDFDALQAMGLVVGDGQMTSDFDLDSWRMSL